MHVIQIWKTSRGLFWDLPTAMKKENRAIDQDNRPGDPKTYEAPKQAYVLSAEVPTNGIFPSMIETMIFELTPAQVK